MFCFSIFKSTRSEHFPQGGNAHVEMPALHLIQSKEKRRKQSLLLSPRRLWDSVGTGWGVASKDKPLKE